MSSADCLKIDIIYIIITQIKLDIKDEVFLSSLDHIYYRMILSNAYMQRKTQCIFVYILMAIKRVVSSQNVWPIIFFCI